MWPTPYYIAGGKVVLPELVYTECFAQSVDPHSISIPAYAEVGDLMVLAVVNTGGFPGTYTVPQNTLSDSTSICAVSDGNHSTGPNVSYRFVKEGEPGTNLVFNTGVANYSSSSFFTGCVYIYRFSNPIEPIRSVATSGYLDTLQASLLGATTYDFVANVPALFPGYKDSIQQFVAIGSYNATTIAGIQAQIIEIGDFTNLHIHKPSTTSSSGWIVSGWAAGAEAADPVPRNKRLTNLLRSSFNDWAGPAWTNTGLSITGYPDQSTGITFMGASFVVAYDASNETRHCVSQQVYLEAGQWYTVGFTANSGNNSSTYTAVADGLGYSVGMYCSVEDDDLVETGAAFYWPGSQTASLTYSAEIGSLANVSTFALKRMTGTGATGYTHMATAVIKPVKTGWHTFRLGSCLIRSATAAGKTVYTSWATTAGVTFTTSVTGFQRNVGEVFCFKGRGVPSNDGWMGNMDQVNPLVDRKGWPGMGLGFQTLSGSSNNNMITFEIAGTKQDDLLYPIGTSATLSDEGRPGPYYDLLTDSVVSDGQMIKVVNGAVYVYTSPAYVHLARGYVSGGYNQRYFEWEVVDFVEPGTNESEIGFLDVNESQDAVATGQADLTAAYNRYVAKDDGFWVAGGVNIGNFGNGVFSNGDVFGFAIDFETHRMSFFKNGTRVYEGPIDHDGTAMHGAMWKPYVTLGFSTNFSQYRFRGRNFLYSPPAGYVPWDPAPGYVYPSPTVITRLYTANDTWTKPVGLVAAKFVCIGAGGGGATSRPGTSNQLGGGGGGSGGHSELHVLAADLAASYPVVVGQGGQGGQGGTFAAAYADETVATAGGTTEFTGLLAAGGGGGGTLGNASTGGTGGAAGTGTYPGVPGGTSRFVSSNSFTTFNESWNYGGGAGGGGGVVNGASLYNSQPGGRGGVFLADVYRTFPAGQVGKNNLTVPTVANDGIDGDNGPFVPALGMNNGGAGASGGGSLRFTSVQTADTSVGGHGGNGGFPGGGGGGAGAVRTPTTANQTGGNGGNGGNGLALVYEYY